MSRKLWVWFLCSSEGVHREVASERPLFAAPQSYLRGQRTRAPLVGENPHHPRAPRQRLLYACLKDRNRLRETPAVEFGELLGQSFRRLLTADLEDRLQILGYLCHRGGRHVSQDVAFEMNGAPLPLGARQLAKDGGLYPFVVIGDHQAYSRKAPVDEPSKQRGVGRTLLRPGHFHGQDLPEALPIHPNADQQSHARHTRAPADLQVGGIQVEVGVFLLFQRALPPLPLLLFEPSGDAAHGVFTHPHLAQGFGEAGDLPDRDPGEVHLQDRLLYVSGHALVALEELRYELALAVSGHLQALDLARRGK